MFFKLTYIIKPFAPRNNDRFEFHVRKNGNEIHIELLRIPANELKKDYEVGDFRCTASIELKVSDKRHDLFKVMTTEVPIAIKDFIAEVSSQLSDAIDQVISNIRWRWGLASLNKFVRFGGVLNWSFDRIEWKAIPNQIRLNARVDFPVRKSWDLDDLKNFQALIATNMPAPLGHELFSEAWTQRASNPRSSLVIGIAAAETAFKECVANLIPEANWLIQNVPSPDLIKMLKEFLPKLPVKAQIKGKTLPPPKKVLDTLRKGITIRNEIVHGKSSTIEEDTLEGILRAVRDLLYLLDFYSGFIWAEDNLSIESVTSLTNDSSI